MNNYYEKNIKIPASGCGRNSQLSVHGMFTLLMDMASEHADGIGMGMDVLGKQGLIWIAVRTKIRFFQPINIFQDVTLATWPGEPVRIRCNRYYTLKSGDTLLADAKNEWTMLEHATGRLHKILDAYPRDFVHHSEIACDTPFTRFKEDFSGCQQLSQHTVTSQDIDSSSHMNNVEYIRAIFSAFSVEEIEGMNISEVEIHYRAQCYEGETLTLYKRPAENGMEIGVVKEDGTTAAVLAIRE